MRKSSTFFLSTFILSLFSINKTIGQNNFSIGVHFGPKISFSDTYKSYNSTFFNEIGSEGHKNVPTLALQGGVRLQCGIKQSNFWLESGISFSGHAHNFKKVWNDKNYLGDKLNHRLTYYVFETPILLEYKKRNPEKKIYLSGFIGLRLNYFGFSPYWGERNPFPWKKDPDNYWRTQTVYFVTNSENGTRRFIQATDEVNLGNVLTQAATGGISVNYQMNKNLHFRTTFSASQGIGSSMSKIYLEVKQMYRDEYNVLVQDGPELFYGSYSRTSNIALDFALLYHLGKE